MIAAHGARVQVTATSVEINYSPLMEALQYHSASVPLHTITDVSVQEPSDLLSGWVHLAGADVSVTFSPRQREQVSALIADISAAREGKAPTSQGAVRGMNFVAFDVETANADWGSICQIGAVKFIDGQPTDSVSWLLTPPPGLEHFGEDNIAIHGITPDQVAGQPDFPTRLSQLTEFVGDLPLVAHNAQFDFTALSRASLACEITPPTMIFGCTLLLARAAKLGLANNRLPTVAAGLDVDLTKHHDATADAAACGGIFVALARRAGFAGSCQEFMYSNGFTMGILEPHRVYPVLRDRSGAGIALQRKKLGADPSPDDTAAAIASPESSTPKRQPAPWSRVSTPEVIPEPNTDADPSGVLFGQCVTLTGDFEPYEKGDLWKRIAQSGGSVGKNVTKKTTILVCGPWATKTSKQKRAEELQEKGQDIAIWTDKELFTALGLNEQPPF
ncbi:exonuclease domain-containing protein [Corynebacterium sp. H128]|uniref:exonuclease domain-containing protein n=1 Tax=Corynebacterium sp. H128 TaxID=3133427 RepID=UPI0030A2B70C